MSYYNIELKTDKPKQSKNAGTTAFSTEQYWTNEGTIYMNDSRNLIQNYINAYQRTLGSSLVATRIV